MAKRQIGGDGGGGGAGGGGVILPSFGLTLREFIELVADSGITFTPYPEQNRLVISASAGSAYNEMQEEGAPVAHRNVVNFVGLGVTVTDDGTKTIVTIPGGGGAAVTSVELDVGAVAQKKALFVVTDAAVTAASVIKAWVSSQTPTGKSADELEMDAIHVQPYDPQAGSFKLALTGLEGPVAGKFKIAYQLF